MKKSDIAEILEIKKELDNEYTIIYNKADNKIYLIYNVEKNKSKNIYYIEDDFVLIIQSISGLYKTALYSHFLKMYLSYKNIFNIENIFKIMSIKSMPTDLRCNMLLINKNTNELFYYSYLEYIAKLEKSKVFGENKIAYEFLSESPFEEILKKSNELNLNITEYDLNTHKIENK